MDIPTPNIFTTTDFSLVTALSALGIPPANHEGQTAQKGDLVEWREIAAKLLEEKGIDFETAVAKGLGDYAYGFMEHPHRGTVIKAFREGRKVADAGGSEEIPDSFVLKCECGKCMDVDVYALLGRFAAYLWAARKYWADRRPKIPAKLRVSSGTGHSLIDPRTV